jgi:hypothetical protein
VKLAGSSRQNGPVQHQNIAEKKDSYHRTLLHLNLLQFYVFFAGRA